MADENKSSAHKDSSKMVEKSLEITNFNWLITNFREKINNELTSPIFCLKGDPSFKIMIVFGHEFELYTLDVTQVNTHFIRIVFPYYDFKYEFSVPHVFKFSIGKHNLVSKSFVIGTGEIDHNDFFQTYITNFISDLEILKCLTDDGCLEIKLKITPIAKTDTELDGKCLTKMKTTFEAFLNSEILSDVVFCIDQCEFSAHKVILASASPVFARMFTTEMKENITNKVEVGGFHPKVFNEMLRYIYTSKIENLKSVAFDLYRLADMYDISGLKSSCEEYLRRNLSDENVIDILEIADSLNSATLKEECISFIDKNLKNIHKTDSFKNIKRDLLFDLFCALRGLEN